MGYASLSGRARTSSKSPQAFGVCDRCGMWYNHVNLNWQFDWAGASLINKRILVCRDCTDEPQNQLRAIVIPADPLPVMNPRTEAFLNDENDNLTTTVPLATDAITGLPLQNPTFVLTQDGQNLSPQPVGSPAGLEQYAISPLFENVTYGVTLPILSMNANGTTIITVTCSAPHGLSTNSQISVEGTTKGIATDGFYSVTVTTATAFTYTVAKNVASGSILGSTTLVKTANVGIPYDFNQIPQVGPTS